MNIFVLHLDPVKAAQMHCDKHVVRCITEQTQLLSFVHRVYDQEHADRCGMFAQNSAHSRHPSTLWLAKNTRNYAWGYALLEAAGVPVNEDSLPAILDAYIEERLEQHAMMIASAQNQ